jgi:hypothetical protein
MSQISYTLLTHSPELSYSGNPVRVDVFGGNTQNLHTVSSSANNFIGRIYIEGTIATSPTENDWFPIYLTSGTSYRQYPVNSTIPTGNNQGDTRTEGFTFRANLLYIRARIDRSYLNATSYDQTIHGSINSILLNT